MTITGCCFLAAKIWGTTCVARVDFPDLTIPVMIRGTLVALTDCVPSQFSTTSPVPGEHSSTKVVKRDNEEVVMLYLTKLSSVAPGKQDVARCRLSHPQFVPFAQSFLLL